MRSMMAQKGKMFHLSSALATLVVLALPIVMAAPALALTTTSTDANYTTG